MKTRQIVSAILLAASLLISNLAHAQAVYGSIYGTVTDNTGAVVPNATITVADTAKGTSTTTTSNASGDFSVAHLIPDVYTVTVAATGFASFVQTNIQVFADASVKVAAALTVGSSTQTVEVNSDAIPLLKTDRADVSNTFSAREVVDLPIPDRDFAYLQLLLPGAQQLGWAHAADENPQGSKQIEVDGQSFGGVSYELDGTDNEDPVLGIIVVNPNLDSLSEAKITTQNFDASFGKAVSSIVTVQTKSGTNQFHGSAFDYRESNANLARDPFTQGPSQLTAASPFPGGLKNQFGGSIGGPIIKNNLFFFGDYQGTRQKVGIAAVQTVPTTNLVSTCLGTTTASNGTAGCDFSQYASAIGTQLAVPNPATYQLLYHTVNGVTTPYPGNVIPAANLSQPALNLLKLLQSYAPNTSSGGPLSALRQNYAGSGTGGFNSNQWDVRGDWTTSQTIHVFGRFSRFTDTLTGKTLFGSAGGAGFGLAGYGGSSAGANDSAAAGVDIAINQNLLTDVRLGYFRYNIVTSKYDGTTDLGTQLGIPGLNTSDPVTAGAPGFVIAEAGAFGTPNLATSQGPQYGSGLNINRCNCPLAEHEDQFQLVNNWTKVLGNHQVKFGGDLRYARNLRVPSDSNRAGILNFGTGPTSNGATGTGLGFATFVSGDSTGLARYVSTSTNAKSFQKRDFFYIQDTWQAKPNLTVNYGLRYEFYFPETVNAPGNGSLLNLATGYLNVGSVGQIASNMDDGRDTNTWAPRVGLAWQAHKNTVVRAGYGRSFDLDLFGDIFGSVSGNLPTLANQQVTAIGGDTPGDTTPAFLLETGPPAYVPVAVPSSGLLPNPGNLVGSLSRPFPLRMATIDAWNATLQQAITPTLSMTIAYVGNKGTHTLGDATGVSTNPNEAGISLPAGYSITGNGLHYDPSVSSTDASGGAAGISANGGTANQTFLSRYYGGKLTACSDPNYAAAGGVNAPNGGCGWTQGIGFDGNNLNTHYNALQATVAKQMANGYSLNANYAWQQAISEATGYATWDQPAVRGRDSALRQQQIIAYGLFQLPFGHNKRFLSDVNGITNQIVGGWEIDPVVTYSSGLPFTLCASNYATWVPSDAPCYVNGKAGSLVKHETGYPGNNLSWYNPIVLGTQGFTQPALDQIGTVGRNTAFGPHFFNTDLSLKKNFPIKESLFVQFRFDAFNAFNHINLGTPNGNIDGGGSITGGAAPNGTANPRQLEFALRVEF